MKSITIHSIREDGLVDFLQLHEFEVAALDNDVLRVSRDSELPVFVKLGERTLYFEVDLGNISEIASADLYHTLLDANTDILPVSFGLNTTNPDDPRLVLVETRLVEDLSDQEILSVFDALELAAEKAEGLLTPYLDR